MKKLISFFLPLLLLILFLPQKSAAQIPNFSIATTYNISEKDLKNGDIISLDKEKNAMVKSSIPYDEKLYGVYVKNPKIVYHTPGGEFPVVRTGEVDVNVTTINGPVVVGDYISSSVIPGFGQKSTQFTGFMLGIALEPFSEKDGSELIFKEKPYRQGTVRVAIGIGPASPTLIKASGGVFGTLKYITSAFLFNIATSRQAERIFRYTLAALVALLSIFFSLYFFGKNITKGLESIGRNPLAKMSIQTMILVNVLLIALVALGGIILSLIILSL